MDKFIADLNIAHLRKQASEEPDEAKRRILLGLLTKEEAILGAIMAERIKPPKAI